MKMKTFYCVTSTFRDDGAVKIALISRECEEKPENSYKSLHRMDVYNDWFNTAAEAAAFMAETEAA
jgi:transcription elongation factor Elf1